MSGTIISANQDRVTRGVHSQFRGSNVGLYDLSADRPFIGARATWATGGGIMTAGLADFHRLWGDLDALKWLVLQRIEQDMRRVAQLSRETATHYKWLLACDQLQGTKVWLHEFKPSSERRPGYAATVHNHRYPFTTVALSGGYSNLRYDVIFDPESLLVEHCEVTGSTHLALGQTYSMEPDEYHYVDQIEDGTKTLIMEFPAMSRVSFSFDRRGDRMTEHLALDARLRNLLRPHVLLAGSGRM